MATKLTPREQVARALVLLHGKDPMAALQMSNATSQAIADLFDNEPDPSDDDVNQAIDDAIGSLGYATDQASLGAQYDHLHATHAGVWSGSYALLDDRKRVHALLINSDDIRLLLDGTSEIFHGPSEGGAFANGKLVMDNDRLALDLTFATSVDGVDLTADGIDLARLSDEFMVTVKGRLTIKAEDSTPRTIQGKRGVSTPAGVLHERGEEPPAIWAGRYQVRYTDTDLWELGDDALVIACDPSTQRLSVSMGTRQATEVVYRANVISCVLPGKDAGTRLTMEMRCTSGGKRKCYLWLETTGQIRTMTGYAAQLLDAGTLWPAKAEVPHIHAAAQANFSGPAALAATTGRSVVDFCRTPYDATFDIDRIVAASTDAGRKTPSDLFAGDAIQVGTGAAAKTVSGFKVDETDAQGNATGRVAMLTYQAPAIETRFFPETSKLRTYQQLDADGIAQVGLANSCVGILDANAYELPGLVEADFYEVRMSLTKFSAIDSAGLCLELAIDDARQPGLIALAQPTARTCPYDPNGGNGTDTSVMSAIVDFTLASALVRGATGETQVVGQKRYHFSALQRTATARLMVTRTIYEPDGATAFKPVGTATTMEVPFLLRVPIQMDSRDAIEISGGSWMPAARGKQYSGAITAMKGQQPFIWRILHDDKPKGLSWSQTPTPPSSDIQQDGLVTLMLSGKVDGGTNPGNTYQPIVRVMSDHSCVMKPVIATPQLTIVEPETENKKAVEIANVASTVAAALAAIGSILVGVVIYKKQAGRERKKDGADKGFELKNLSADSLHAIGKEFGDLAKAAKDIKKNKGYMEGLDKRVEALKSQMEDISDRIESIGTRLQRAKDKQEIERLQNELDTAREELKEQAENLNEGNERQDSADEQSDSEESE